MGGSLTASYNINSDGVIQSATIEQIEKVTPLSADAGKVMTDISYAACFTYVRTVNIYQLLSCSGRH